MANHLSYDVLMRDVLMASVEQHLPTDEDLQVRRHLARCGRCRSEREWLKRIRLHPDPAETDLKPLPLN